MRSLFQISDKLLHFKRATIDGRPRKYTNNILSSPQQQLRQLHSKHVKQQHLSLHSTISTTMAAMMSTPPITIRAICQGCSNMPSPSNQHHHHIIVVIIIIVIYGDES